MELEDLIKAVQSKDFEKNLKAFSEREKAAKDAEQALGRSRDLLARRTEDLDARKLDLDRRERSVKGKETALANKQAEHAGRVLKVSEAETAVEALKAECGRRESAAKEKMARAEKLIESNEKKKARLVTRLKYLDKIPA